MKRLLMLAVLTALAACSESDPVTAPTLDIQPSFASVTGEANRALPRPRPEIWVDGELFSAIVAPATFNPESDPFDELYAGGPNVEGFMGFGGGVPLISESKPGDSDYNGGRWHVNVLKEGVDPFKYYDLGTMSVEDLDMADFISTDAYFECPLLPVRGNN